MKSTFIHKIPVYLLAVILSPVSLQGQTLQSQQQQVQSSQQLSPQQQAILSNYMGLWEQQNEEAKTFYAHADTANYGIRYRFTYVFDKQHRRTYKEDRIVWINPHVTLDMSYQPVGEREWVLKNAGNTNWTHRDPSLAYRLTPSFYFYYPKEHRLKSTYRIISEEFATGDAIIDNQWTITDETKKVGGYSCKKATSHINGRNWIAWFTNELPYEGGPRHLTGLPGVILEATDENHEIVWNFAGKVENNTSVFRYILYPEKLSAIPASSFPLIKRLFATSAEYIQKSGVLNKDTHGLPQKMYPHTGIDACIVTNPIDL